ncbi:hypothetical protein AMTRI_Chr07g30350 [Amborella trichopoda]
MQDSVHILASFPVKHRWKTWPMLNQSIVNCLYEAEIAGFQHQVTMTWCKNLVAHGLSIALEKLGTSENHYICKIKLKLWYFWIKKGFKSFKIDGQKLDFYWDLRAARFSESLESFANFCVALVCEEEVVLLIRDLKDDAFKRTKARSSLTNAALLSKRARFWKEQLCNHSEI